MKDDELGQIYSDNEFIFKEGDTGESIYIIQSGSVNITKYIDEGEVTLATLRSGDIFGEMSLFGKLPHSAAARASGGARVLSIDRKRLSTSISKDPALAFKILETMSRRIRELYDGLAGLNKENAGLLKSYANVDDTCKLILEEATKIIKADNCSIMLLNPDDTLSIKTAFGTESRSKVKLASGQGIAGSVLETGRAELLNNVAMDPRFKSGEIQIKSLLCAPITSAGRNIGVINMSTIRSDRAFTADDLRRLHRLSICASLAIQNALSLAGLKEAAENVLLHASVLDLL